MLTATDSLMDTDPEAAMYSIMTIDSTIIPLMRKRDRARYLLLRTEARYKCSLPVREDTAINKAVSFFANRGPKSSYASALALRGAVGFENGDFVSALKDYKDAEAIIQDSGSFLKKGMLHTRIAELYRLTFVNDSITVERYRKALECFQQAEQPDYILQGQLSLARALLHVSPDEAFPHILAGSALARQLADTNMMLVAKELKSSYLLAKGLYNEVIHVNRRTCRQYGRHKTPAHESPMANIMLATATAYAKTGHPDSAKAIARGIPCNALDKAVWHRLNYDIAVSEGDMDSAIAHLLEENRITDSTSTAGYQMHLRGVEKRHSADILNEQYSSFITRYKTFLIILAGMICAISTVAVTIYSRNMRLKRKMEKDIAIIRNFNKEKQTTSSGGRDIAGQGSLSVTEEMLKITDELMDAYYKYGKTRVISSYVKAILEHHFPNGGTMARVVRIVDSIYPGYLAELHKNYPSLSEKDIYLIAMMACGFSTGTICALRRISENSLYVEKTRVAKKIGENIRLADFISRSLQAARQS